MKACEVIYFWNMLEDLTVECEEARNVDRVTLDNYKNINRGNSCMHYILTENDHRIILQIHKNGIRQGKVDVVQGDPATEIGLEDLVDLINSDPVTYTDNRLNKLFIQYWNIWPTCTSWYETGTDGFLLEFGPKMSIWYNNFMWYFNVNDATIEEMATLQNFIDTINDICKGR